MTPQFTTSCYVQVDNKIKRKEVCEKLEQMGYRWRGISPQYLDHIVVSDCLAYVQTIGVAQQLARYNCSTNIDLFLALAGMRSDTDKGQWFVFIENVIQAVYDKNGQDTGARYKDHSVGDMYQCPYSDIMSSMVRRATTAEIVKHFKTKEK